MKKILIITLLVGILGVAGLGAQNTSAGATNGMTFSGATGLIIVPDARIGWEKSNFGLDVGYGFILNSGQNNMDHLPRFSLSIAKKVEISGLFHFGDGAYEDFKNFILGAKVQIFSQGGSALAIGTDVEMGNVGLDNMDFSSKIYLAATYSGSFFDVPAVTTATIGWQMFDRDSFNSQFIYGMGFSMSLFPDAFKNHVFWITDFANFSYAVYRPKINAISRGAFNTGVRIRPFKKGSFNMIIDILGTDLLDDGQRGFGLSISGGLAF